MHHRTDRTFSLVAIGLASIVVLAGCEEPRVVKPLKTPDPAAVREAREARERARRPAATPMRTAVVTPEVRLTPEPRGPLTLHPTFITRIEGSGSTSTEEASLVSNGAFWFDLRLNRTIRQSLLEARGQAAGGVWPQVDVTAFTVGPEPKVFTVWSRDFLTTDTHVEMVKDLERPMPPGHYQVIFRYYNNSDNVPEGEDRNVWMKRIILYP
jgi:hypothetical protein